MLSQFNKVSIIEMKTIRISKEIEWVRIFYPGGDELKPKELGHILAFGIVWNIFESIIILVGIVLCTGIN